MINWPFPLYAFFFFANEMLIEGFVDPPIPYVIGINKDKFYFKRHPEY